MNSIKVAGDLRTDLGKKGTKAIRDAGGIPCIIYGGEETVHFSSKVNDFRDLIYTADFRIAEITVGKKTYQAFVKDIQFHPVTDNILHIDFVELVPGKFIKLEIPIHLVGQAEGALLGGVVQKKMHRVLIKAKPEALVEYVQVDISGLNLGQSVRVRDIEEIEGITIMSLGATPVASVNVPRALRSEEAAAEEEGEELGEEGEEVAEETAAEE